MKRNEDLPTLDAITHCLNVVRINTMIWGTFCYCLQVMFGSQITL